ncbi:MAG: hypothetical protein ISS01_02870 [Nanoarchaeota archaeon]|nr:hypothetical protein [Nanoarchaeota archaeon]
MDIFSDTIFRDLEKLNFSINESKVYLTLIRLGPSLAGIIAKEARLDRSSTYNALESLTKRGIVTTIHENKRNIFVPEDPKKIIDYYQEKEEIAKKIIPKLRENFSTKKKSSVKLFQGYKGIKTILQDILDSCDSKNPFYVMGSEGYFSQKMPYFAPVFKKRKEMKKIKSKVLVRKKRENKSNWKFSEYRTTPSEVISEATVNIYGDKIAILIWDDNPKAILIENESVAKTFENYFNFMWKNSKD